MGENKFLDISASFSDIWKVLDEKEHKLLRENVRFVSFKKNEIAYYENDKPEDLMCLLKGKIKIYK
ncbi:MAG TPA: Crp/Fnr family transcriptional regulator, partial [Dysgonamonadaceae bacterium]|nr:Crp/Fnr family transcriptional regulator [Dysgonamonadaceae bacterium]